LPQLEGALDGSAIRGPVANVSRISLTVVTERSLTAAQINDDFQQASAERWRGILACTDQELVSVDFNGASESCIFDMTQTQVLPGNLARVVGWYDNETGFAHRMIDLCSHMGTLL
jgi:glyceraldehyde 3-phosphate dehydrogenase